MTAPNEPADGGTDAGLDRVRAADPAANAEPDASALGRAVRERLGDIGGGPVSAADAPAGSVPGTVAAASAAAASAAAVVGAEPLAADDEGTRAGLATTPGGPDELAARRPRRLRAPLRVAAAVAGVLAVGAGGYALGNAGTRGGTGTQQADAAIVLDESAVSDAAPSEADAAAGPARAGTSTGPGYWGARIVFHGDGLSTDGGSAPAWAYDAAGVFSADTARRAAAALGVAGEAREEYGAFVVGPSDYTGPVLTIQPDGLASVSFTDPTKDPWACGEATAEPGPAEPAPADAPDSGAASDGAASDGAIPPDAPCQPKDQGAAPGADAATASFRDLLAGLGLDPSSFEFEAQPETTDTAATWLDAYEVVDGQRTGNTWTAGFVATGVYTLNGPLAPLVPIGTYDVVSPAEAVARLGDPRFGAGYGPIAMEDAVAPGARVDAGAEAAADGSADSSVSSPADTPTVPATVGADSPIAWPVADVTITGARLGAAVSYQPDGAAVLLPAYELTDADGNSWSVVAVVDSRLDFAAK